mmetsp:Transcript_249/g.373  ORF Transcript_249/g.373 Transcript_249/m.373 type:complete len:96 (+) Transcript_249:23-310(+)
MKFAFLLSCVIANAVAFAPSGTQRAVTSMKAVAEAEDTTVEEKKQEVEDVYEIFGFFPDMRDEKELPKAVRNMREFKDGEELAEIKAKYNAISDD